MCEKEDTENCPSNMCNLCGDIIYAELNSLSRGGYNRSKFGHHMKTCRKNMEMKAAIERLNENVFSKKTCLTGSDMLSLNYVAVTSTIQMSINEINDNQKQNDLEYDQPNVSGEQNHFKT